MELEKGAEFGWGSAPMTPADCQAYVNKVVRSQWSRKRYGKQTIKVVYSPQAHRGRACKYTGTIWVGGKNPKSMTTRYLLHEIAHIIKTDHHEAGHGISFCATYLELVKHFLGKQFHDVLRDSFKYQGVRYRPKAVRAKRVLTEEQRAVLVARLAKAREVKSANAAIKEAEVEIDKLRPWLQTYRDSLERTSDDRQRDDLANKIHLVDSRIGSLHAKVGNLKYAIYKSKGLVG
jgi:putative metallohydrolase (TIGR04338 family)